MTEGYRRASLDPSIKLFGRKSSILALPAPPSPQQYQPPPNAKHNGHQEKTEKPQKLELISSTIQFQFSPVFLEILKQSKKPNIQVRPERLVLGQELRVMLNSYKLTRFPLHRPRRRASIHPINTEKVRNVKTDLATSEALNAMGKFFILFYYRTFESKLS